MKNTISLAAAAASALLLLGAPGTASADASGPIRIDSFQITDQNLSEHNVVPVGTTIAFTNTSDSPATDVVLGLQSDGAVLTQFEDTGSFAKGVTIKKYFAAYAPDNAERVVVLKATFADGTVWNNPDVALVAPAVDAGAPN